MSAPRLEIDLGSIHDNARTLVGMLASRGISVTGITKATSGLPEIARTLLRAGVTGLGDSRIENIETMRQAHVRTSMTLIRTPMLSQADRVVKHADVSFNTELDVISMLSSAGQRTNRMHGIVLMVELGDLREGIMPGDLENTVRETLRFPNIAIRGIGANLACYNGVAPDARKMSELSRLVDSIEAKFPLSMDIVSGGNSANLNWVRSGTDLGRINNVRLGESILLGVEALNREPVEGLRTDAITLVAEVIESKVKPSQPWGVIAQTAFGKRLPPADRGNISQAILAIGHQDTDPLGLGPPRGIKILGASSDHLVVEVAGSGLTVGAELRFQLNYSALLRAMTSPFVAKVMKIRSGAHPALNSPFNDWDSFPATVPPSAPFVISGCPPYTVSKTAAVESGNSGSSVRTINGGR
jgi:predicted amino acid racemase